MWHLRPSDVDVQLLTYTWDLMKALPAECGQPTGFTQNGGLFIAHTKQRLDDYKRLMTARNTIIHTDDRTSYTLTNAFYCSQIGCVFGIESEVLSPVETRRRWPLVDCGTLYGTMHSPIDGTIDPAAYCLAITRAAQSNGAQVLSLHLTVVDLNFGQGF